MTNDSRSVWPTLARTAIRSLLIALVISSVTWRGLSADDTPDKTTYDNDVQPIFRSRCANCHNSSKRSGDLDVTNYNSLMQGGSSGPVIEPGNSSQSYLYKLITHEDEPSMPPSTGKIPDPEIALIAKWIDGGVLENSGSKARGKKNNSISVATNADAMARPESPAMPGHLILEPFVHTDRAGTVSSLATSPWSPLVAVASAEQVLLYRLDNLELAGVLPFPEGQPNIVKFSRDGQLVIAGGGRGASLGIVAIWDVQTGERIATIGNELEAVLAADISNDHRQVALGGPERMVRVYSTETGELQYEIKKHTDWVLSLAFSPDGVLLASGDRAGGLYVWEAGSGREYLSLRGPTAAVTALSWRFDSNILASAGEDNNIRLWEMENGGQVKNWGAHGGGVLDVKFNRDGNLVSCGRDMATKLWDQNGAQVRAFPNTADVPVTTALSDESHQVITADFQGNITLWNAADAAPVGTLAANPPTLNERLTTAQADVGARQAELDPLASNMNNLQTQLDAMRKSLETSRQQLTTAQSELATLQTQAEASRQSIAAWQGEKADFESKLNTSREAQPLLVAALNNALEAAKKLTDSPEVQTSADAMGEQVKALEGKIASLQQQVTDRNDKLVAGQKALNDMNAAIEKKQGEVNQLTATIQKLETEIQPVQQQFDTLSQQVAGVRDSLNQAQQRVQRWQNEITFVATMKSLQEQLAAAEGTVDERSAAVDAATAELKAAQEKLDAARAAAQQAIAAADELRQKIESTRDGTADAAVQLP